MRAIAGKVTRFGQPVIRSHGPPSREQLARVEEKKAESRRKEEQEPSESSATPRRLF